MQPQEEAMIEAGALERMRTASEAWVLGSEANDSLPGLFLMKQNTAICNKLEIQGDDEKHIASKYAQEDD